MKAIIYTGIGLFCAASVYGVVDYYTEKKQGTISMLYAEEAPETGLVSQNAVTAVTTGSRADVKPAALAAKAPVKARKRRKGEKVFVKTELFSRNALVREEPVVSAAEVVAAPAAIPVAEVAEKPADIPAAATADKPVAALKPVVAKEPEERALRMEMFSRAPLKRKLKNEKPAAVPVEKPAEQ